MSGNGPGPFPCGTVTVTSSRVPSVALARKPEHFMSAPGAGAGQSRPVEVVPWPVNTPGRYVSGPNVRDGGVPSYVTGIAVANDGPPPPPAPGPPGRGLVISSGR